MTKPQIKIILCIILALLAIRAGAILLREVCAVSAASRRGRESRDIDEILRARLAATEALARMWEAVPLAGGALRDLQLRAGRRDELLESLRAQEEITASIERTRRYLE